MCMTQDFHLLMHPSCKSSVQIINQLPLCCDEGRKPLQAALKTTKEEEEEEIQEVAPGLSDAEETSSSATRTRWQLN